jgi:branched-chain amino acid transport system substrate-binding protein
VLFIPSRHARTAFAAAALTVAALVLSACSSGGASSSTQSSSSSSADSVLGPVKAATGTPLTLGYITDGKSAAIDFTALQQTAQAAVQYVNERLGGVAGHPINLKICETQQVPSRAIDCANQMIQAKVPVVLNDVTGEGTYLVPPLVKAGIPYVTFEGSAPEELTTKNAYSLTGSVATLLGGIAGYAKQSGVKKMAILAFNVPSIIAAVNSLGKLVFGNAGIALQVIPVTPGSPDLNPQMEQVISGNADAFLGIADSTVCAGILKAAKSLNYTGKEFLNSECIAKSAASAIPGGYRGVTISATTKQQAGDKDYDLYAAVLNHYSPKTASANLTNIGAVLGYGAVLGFARAMTAGGVTSGDVTASVVTAAMPKAKNVVQPVGGNVTFTCDGTAVPGLTGICGVGAQITTLTQDGAPTTYTTIDPSTLFK